MLPPKSDHAAPVRAAPIHNPHVKNSHFIMIRSCIFKSPIFKGSKTGENDALKIADVRQYNN
jgi:hypothetical protein